VDDVVIVGGGPAGTLAAVMLATEGVRVRVFERAGFPRPKLCGDTLSPGALTVLSRHVPLGAIEEQSLAVPGMRLTGPGGVRLEARYRGRPGRSVTRAVLDGWLLAQAEAAGAGIEHAAVAGPVWGGASDAAVAGVRVQARGGTARTHPARLVIAADGRRSTLTQALGLSVQPRWPRRWAVGAYFTDVDGLGPCGEMHVRSGHYLGVAPVPGGLANACLVTPAAPLRGWRDPTAYLRAALAADAELGPRFRRARTVTRAMVLGPMAVDVTLPGAPGLLLAGDAAGFVDPLTGDGLRLAFSGAEMAAALALDVLDGRTPIASAPAVLARRRRRAFGRKWRFNRLLRRLVDSPVAVGTAARVAGVAPALFAAVIRYAGDDQSKIDDCRMQIARDEESNGAETGREDSRQ
jgi:flavin-dependent dehydrogenase